MAQTTGGISFANVKAEISANGSAWTDISGVANGVKLSGGDRQVGEAFTAQGDTPIITAGKRRSLDIEFMAVYTEGAEAFETLRPIFEAGTLYYFRFSPKGGATGQFQYASDAGYLTDPFYPQGEVGSADPVMVSFKLKTAKVTKSVVP